MLLLGGQPLADLLGIPSALAWPLGLFLLAYAAALVGIQARPNPPAVQRRRARVSAPAISG